METRNVAHILGHGVAMDFHNTLGRDRVEARCRQLSNRLRSHLLQIPRLRLMTPMQPELSSGLVTFAVDGMKQAAIKEEFEVAEAHGEAYHPHEPAAYVLTPYVRAAATDLNLTIGLALLVVLWSHVIGFRRLGPKYARRFALPVITGMKPIDLFVGLLEFISEFAKIISLSFRLFGNIFAGQVLLFVMAFLVSFLLPLPFMGLELFVGFMQAFVFAILTFIYFEQATHSHAGDEHH